MAYIHTSHQSMTPKHPINTMNTHPRHKTTRMLWSRCNRKDCCKEEVKTIEEVATALWRSDYLVRETRHMSGMPLQSTWWSSPSHLRPALRRQHRGSRRSMQNCLRAVDKMDSMLVSPLLNLVQEASYMSLASQNCRRLWMLAQKKWIILKIWLHKTFGNSNYVCCMTDAVYASNL